MDPSTLFLPNATPVLKTNGFINDVWWKYFQDIATGLGTVDLDSQVTGILPPVNGGTGINNSTRTLTLTGASLALTMTGATALTLPTAGTVVVTTSPVTAVNLTVTTGVTPDSGAIKHKRVTTGSITAGTSALVTVGWMTAFASSDYTVIASVVDATAATASLSVVHIEEVTAASVKVRVQNTAAGDLTGTLDVIAMHD